MPRTALLLLAATSGILVAAVAPTVAPAQAAGSVPTISIVAPSAGQTVTGGVDFTVSIDGVASTDPATVVDFAITSGTRYRKSQSITVAGDGCVPNCTVTAHFDTASLDTSSFQAAGPIADLPDGVASFAASVTSHRARSRRPPASG